VASERSATPTATLAVRGRVAPCASWLLLPRLQGLTAVALECANLGRSANGALQAMRV
jgi:hypothetical protein